VEIATNGDITDTPIDSLEFDTKKGSWSDIAHVSGNIYAIAYRGNKNDGFLKTIEISPDGTITNSVIDTIEFDTQNCIYPDIIRVASDICAIAYQGNKADGFLKTIEIDGNGQITDTVIDTLEFDTSNGREPDIIHIAGDIYAIAYRGNNKDGYLKTVEIASDGEISNTAVDTFEFNPYECYFPDITHIAGDIYALAYAGASPPNDDWWGGVLTTVEIASDGGITDSTVDEIMFDTDSGEFPDIIQVSGGIFGIAYTGPGYDGFLKTVEIAADGSITDVILDTLEFDNRVGYCPSIITVSGDIFAIAYTGTSQWHGILKTVEITTGSGTSSAYEIVSTGSSHSIRAYVEITGDNVSVISWHRD